MMNTAALEMTAMKQDFMAICWRHHSTVSSCPRLVETIGNAMLVTKTNDGIARKTRVQQEMKEVQNTIQMHGTRYSLFHNQSRPSMQLKILYAN